LGNFSFLWLVTHTQLYYECSSQLCQNMKSIQYVFWLSYVLRR